MNTLKLTIFGEPRTKSNRVRSCVNKKTGKAYTYKDPRDVKYEAEVKRQVGGDLSDMKAEIPVFPRETVLRASFKFYFSRRPSNRDAQNYFKSVCDALEGLVYVNDAQLVSVYGEKFHDKERPRIEIKVWRDGE